MTSLSVNGTDLWYVDRGVGLPLLLIHGFPLDHTMWAGQIEALASRCRVIAPDLPGFGRSPAFPGDGQGHDGAVRRRSGRAVGRLGDR